MTVPGNRRGEKLGWTWGWIGGFVWLPILGTLWVLNGQMLQGISAFTAFVVGCIATVFCAPWRHPRTPYWKLLLPVYAVLFAAIALMLLLYPGATRQIGLNVGNLFLLLPMLLPFVTLGRRRWEDATA